MIQGRMSNGPGDIYVGYALAHFVAIWLTHRLRYWFRSFKLYGEIHGPVSNHI